MNQNHHYHQPSVQHSGFLDDSGYSIMPSAVISNDRPTVNHNNPQSPPSRPTPIDYSDDFSYGSFQGRQFFSIALSCTGFLRIRKHRQFFHHDFKYIIWKIFQMFKISFLIFHMFQRVANYIPDQTVLLEDIHLVLRLIHGRLH